MTYANSPTHLLSAGSCLGSFRVDLLSFDGVGGSGNRILKRLLRSERDKSKSAGLLRHRVHFDGTFFDCAKFLKMRSQIRFIRVERETTTEEFPARNNRTIGSSENET